MILGIVSETFCFANGTAFMIVDVREANEREDEQENVKYVQQITQKFKQTGAGGRTLKEQIASIALLPKTDFILRNAPTRPQVFIQERFCLKDYTNKILNSIRFPKLYLIFHCPKTYLA